MAKIRVEQIKDLSLTTAEGTGVQTLTVGTNNSIIPLTTVAPATVDKSVVTGLEVVGNTVKPTYMSTATLLGSYYTKSEVDGLFDAKLADFYTKRELDTKFGDYYTKNQVDTKLADYYTSVQVDAKFAGYYTKAETDNLLNGKLNTKLLNAGTLVASSTTTIPSEKTVADYVASQIAADAYNAGAGIAISDQHVISANFDLEIVEGENGVTNLVIKDGETPIASVDASQFVVDGMLKDASFSTETNDLTLTFKTAAEGGVTTQDIVIPLDSLVDVYTGTGVIEVSNAGVISHKTSSVTAGTYGATADATATTFGSSIEVKVPSFTVTAEGHVSAASDKTVTVSLPSLPDSIGTAVQTVEGDAYVGANRDGNTVTLATVTGDVAQGEDKLATAASVKAYVDSKVPKEVKEGEISFENSKIFRTTFTGQYCGTNMGLNASMWTIDQNSVCVYINGQLIPDNDGDNYTISQDGGNWSVNVSRNQFDADGSDFTVVNTDRIDVVAHGTQYQTLKVLQFKQEES